MWMRLIPIRLLLPRSWPRIHSALQVRGKREVVPWIKRVTWIYSGGQIGSRGIFMSVAVLHSFGFRRGCFAN